MLERIEYKNTSLKRLEVIIEPDADSFYFEPAQSMIIHLNNVRPKYKDELALEYDGDILSIFLPRQSDAKIFINNEKVYFSTPGRPMWEY